MYLPNRMAERTKQPPKNRVLILGPPSMFRYYREQFHQIFDIINPHESSLPLGQFLSTQQANNIQAMLCSPNFRNIDATVFDQLPALRFIFTTSAGLDHIDLIECRRRQISLANVGTLFAAPVADLTVGLLIDVLRKISDADRFVRNGLWPGVQVYPLGAKLGSRKVGIVGLGSIGLEVAKRLEAFGCVISYFSRQKKSSISYQFYGDINELATNCDVLIICCPLNDKTRHLINKEVLLCLGENGVVVNIARGSVILEKELIEFLQQGKIAGAGLDVFENEPGIAQELGSLDNVVLTPHHGVFTEETFNDIFELACANLEAFFSGKPLPSLVSLQ